MLKRVLACFCSFLIVFSFCCQCFVVSAATEGSSGGGGHRGDYIDLSRSEIDTEKTQAQINADFIDQFVDDPAANIEDFFYYCLGSVGAVFSDETTLKSVRNQYNAIYANALSSPEEMRRIFYYGTDGQLYFTDDFLNQFRNIVDENSFNQGVFSIPYTTNETFYQSALSIGCLAITNSITSCLNGDDARLMVEYGDYFNTGFSTVGLYPVFPFSSFSAYRNFCDTSVSSSFLNIYLYSSSTSKVVSDPIYPWNKTPSGGSFSTATTGNAKYATFFSNSGNGLDYFTVSDVPRVPGYPRYTAYAGFVGLGTFEAYRSVDHMQYYLSGGTGVIRGNTYYAMDNAQNPDNIFGKDWKAYYQGLQKQYKELAGEVAAGNKTLKEINQTLSDQILDTVADISQDVAQQTNYLKKILEEIRSISSKLTYSNVVGTVTAAGSLLSSICDALDSLFGGEDGTVFSLLDFVENHILNESGQTAASIMKSVFPFSLPQDFYLILELLSVDPQTPQVHFKFELKRLNMSYDYTYVADDFAKLAYMTRFFSSVGFVLLLINFTNKILKK